MANSQLSIIRPGPVLAGRTTLGIGGKALAEAVVRTESELDALADFIAAERGRPFVLGGGSNLLFDDRELDLVILSVVHDELEISGNKVRVGAGMKLPVLLNKLQKAGLTGLEGLAGIPGTVGGALAMNAGSWGTALGDKITRAGLWTPLSSLTWLDQDNLSFGYRTFTPAIPGKWMAWAVELELEAGEPSAIKTAMSVNMNKKKSGQPVGEKTAGCVFKNPEGDAAGRLLDAAGMKGAALGDMEFSKLHANFMVNKGSGTFAQAVELMEQGQKAVEAKFGVQLETEVIVVS